MSIFSDSDLRKIDDLGKRYPTREALVLPVLWMAQQQRGWISKETIEETAALLGVPAKQVYGVVSFYTMFNTAPVGRYHLQVCRNVSCQLLGSEKIVEHISRKLGIRPGETTPDKKFTLSEVECLGSCGTAPAMQVNDEYHENLTPEKVDRLLESLR